MARDPGGLGYGLQNRTGGFDSRSRIQRLLDQWKVSGLPRPPHAASSPVERAKFEWWAERGERGKAALSPRPNNPDIAQR